MQILIARLRLNYMQNQKVLLPSLRQIPQSSGKLSQITLARRRVLTIGPALCGKGEESITFSSIPCVNYILFPTETLLPNDLFLKLQALKIGNEHQVSPGNPREQIRYNVGLSYSIKRF